jgi:hypothetical protein
VYGTVGDGVTCTAPSALKDEAYAICKKSGLNLDDISYAEIGDCGLYATHAKYACCPSKPSEPEPEPEPEPDPCAYGTVGDGVTCTAPSALKDEAYAICKKSGLSLEDISYAEIGNCGLYATHAKYACCPSKPSEPEPEPVFCTEGTLSNGLVCQDHIIFKLAAIDACTKAGLIPTDLFYGEEGCPVGQAYKAGYTCCEAAPKSP